ncbi:MAG TPA: copper chaperone PCu(A)C [Devosiaceae bacterium]|jgi:copper(I)-binding protein|nr:copper chaperone PCu(A)C [Devosiaceae bacterium]
MRLSLLVLLCAIGVAPSHAHEFPSGALLVDHPVIRETPPRAQVAGGYLTIVNNGTEPDTLLSIESDVAKSVELHRSVITDGIASMRPLEGGLPVPAGASARLGDDGTHAMFIEPVRPLVAGEEVPAVLVFEKAGRVPVVFNVEKITADQGIAHDH